MEPVLYFYTSGTVLNRILKQKSILPDRSEPENENEIPTVCFSSDPIWERTKFRVGKLPNGQLVMMSKKLLQRFDGGVFRILVPATIAQLDWHQMKEECRLSRSCTKAIYDFAVSVGARTRNWYGTTESVPEDIWLGIERLDGDENWIKLSDDEFPDPDSIFDNSPVVDLPISVVPPELEIDNA